MSKVVVICGISSGLGSVVAKEFSHAGYRVIGTVRSLEKQSTLPYTLVEMDVTDDQSVQLALNEIRTVTAKIDVLINCFNALTVGAIIESSMEDFDNMYSINVLGLVRVCRAFIPLFLRQKRGTIVNMSSLGGILAVPYMSGYTSTKFAIEAFSEAMYYELKPSGVNVLIMQPVAMRMERQGSGEHLKLATGVASGSPSMAMYDMMQKDTLESPLSTEEVAARILATVSKSRVPLRVTMNRARLLSVVKRLLPQRLLDRIIADAVHIEPLTTPPTPQLNQAETE